MTKRVTDFAEEDLAMARRALWSVEWPSRVAEEPPVDLDMTGLSKFTGSLGFLVPLAHFALIREADALRSGRPRGTTRSTERSACVEGPQLQGILREEACAAEMKSNEQLREAKLRMSNALVHWRAAIGRRAELYRGVRHELLTGELEAILAAVLDAELKVGAALDLMDRSMRWQLPSNHGDKFPSLLGLPRAERNAGLNSQALHLHEAGYSDALIAYVMGWAQGTPEQIRERMRHRLDDARARELGEAAG